MTRASDIIQQIKDLKAELNNLQPYETMSVRAIANASGISPTTALRLKNNKIMDVPTIHKLIKAKLLHTCPCCSSDISNILD